MNGDTNLSSRSGIGSGAKLFAGVMAVMGALKLVDIVYAGFTLEGLLNGTGFLAMAYGMAKNGFGKVRPVDVVGRYASAIGAVFVLVSFALRWMR